MSINQVAIAVCPRIRRDCLETLNGVNSVGSKLSSHSNLTRFPRRVNRGRTETAYCWKVVTTDVVEPSRFLNAFDAKQKRSLAGRPCSRRHLLVGAEKTAQLCGLLWSICARPGGESIICSIGHCGEVKAWVF